MDEQKRSQQQDKVSSLLAEVEGVLLHRGASYGDITECFSAIAALWSIRLQRKLKDPITPGEVADLMTLLKTGRKSCGEGKRDNYIDSLGYDLLSLFMYDEGI